MARTRLLDAVLTERQAVELFHLHFVRLLSAGPEKERLAIKGGCNLRFFFGSLRYSEELDLDVGQVPVHALREKVDRLLAGPTLALPLKSRGIAVRDASAPKQTETTQRWKASLSLEGRAAPLHTKIEFSRRATKEQARVEPIDAAVLAEHQLVAFLAPHYPLEAALRQKVGALVGRSAVQARDVFDLAVLLARVPAPAGPLGPLRSELPRAIERAMDVSWADYKSQVGSYLKPEDLDAYGSRDAWDALQAQVVEKLEAALR